MNRDTKIQILPTLFEELKGTLEQKIVKRVLTLPDIKNKALVTMGMRRTGKTFFLYQQIQQLLNQKVPWQQILYINFEDDRLLPMNQKEMAHLLESFYTLYPENHDRLCYLFLDEVQNVEGWAAVVRRFMDTKKVKIFLSGSSAKLLSKEIASVLRGRSLAVEIWPYNFMEYLRVHNMDFPTQPTGKKNQDQMLKELGRYLKIGGFPEVQMLDAEMRTRILQDYVNLVVLKDIMERYEITNITLMRYLIKTLVGAAGNFFAVNKMFNDLKSQGFKVSKNTLYEYLSYVEDAYLAFAVPLLSPSIRKQQANPRKIYLIDPGLLQAERLIRKDDWGFLFENLIYLDLRRKNHKVFYYMTKERYEIDFVTQDLNGKTHLFQVAWSTEDEETLKREERALRAAEKELGIRGELITADNYFGFQSL
ncbi:MAG: hypothetical protein A3H42_04880 [Deltaproteobacteria bacterium RIFCSPLOWO2_02_FULL_46_8]|nr:MAG: hypothetical protein A3H42_04880 [Deltaproteobacteria bacterium RIFCSPLOWO2_02_FULL_46_8]